MEQTNTFTFIEQLTYYSDMCNVIASLLPHSQWGFIGTCKTLNLRFLDQAMYVFCDSEEDIKFLDFKCIERSRRYSNPKSWGPIQRVNISGLRTHDHVKFPIRAAFVERYNMIYYFNRFGSLLTSIVLINGPLDYISLESMVSFFPDLKYLCCLKYKGGLGDALSRVVPRAKNLCELGLIWTKCFDRELFLLPTPTTPYWTKQLERCTMSRNLIINPINHQWRSIPGASTTLPSPFVYDGKRMDIHLNWYNDSGNPKPVVPLETEIPFLLDHSSLGSPQQQPYKVQLDYYIYSQDGTARVIRINLTGDGYQNLEFRPELLGKIIIPVPPKL